MVALKVSEAFPRALKSSWSRTLAAYGTTQAVLAVGAFLRIPLLVASVAATGYGSIVAFSGLCVVVLAVADGLSQATRAITAERSLPNFGRLNRLYNLASTVGVVAVVGFLVSGTVALVISPSGDNPWAAGLLCMGFSATALFGGPAKGFLEGTGKTALVHLLQTSTTVLGLPLLFVVLFISPSLVAASAVTGLGLALPYLGYLLAVGISLKSVGVRIRHSLYGPRRLRSVSEVRAVKSMTVWAWSNSLNYAFDASIVSLVAGTVAAGEFGLASRVMTLAMLLSLALNPLITARVSSWRTSYDLQVLLAKVRRLSLLVGLVSLAVCMMSIALGPWLAGLLSHNQIASPLSLYLALAIFAFTSAVTAPLMGVFAGAGGAKYRAQMSAALAVLNVCLSVILTLTVGINGPIVSSTITLILLAVILLVRIKQQPHTIMEKY